MTDHPDQPDAEEFPSSHDEISFGDENDITVILPEDDEEEDVGDPALDVTETVPIDPEEDQGEVFVLLPDAEESEIPMVDTEAVDATEQIGLQTTFDASLPTASQVGLQTANPLTYDTGDPGDPADTEAMVFDEATEECMIAEEPTDPMGPEDLDGLASEVADDFFVGESDQPYGTDSPDDFAEQIDFDEGFHGEVVTAKKSRKKRKKRSAVGKIFLSMAALIAIAVAGLYFFPEYRERALAYLPAEWVDTVEEWAASAGLIERPAVVVDQPPSTGVGDGGSVGVTDVDPTGPEQLALQSRELFRNKFRKAIDKGFAVEVSNE